MFESHMRRMHAHQSRGLEVAYILSPLVSEDIGETA